MFWNDGENELELLVSTFGLFTVNSSAFLIIRD